MEDYLSLQLERQEANRAKRAAVALQQAKLKALQDTIGNYGNFRYVNLNDFLDPDNQNWSDYKWSRLPAFESAKRQEHISAGTPVGMLIQQIRDAENIDDVKKQLELWNSYKPLDLPHNGESYVNHFIYGLNNVPYRDNGVSKPVFPTTDGSDPVQTTAGGTQGTQDVQGVQAGAQTGGTGGMQAGNSGGTGGAQAGGTGSGTSGTQGMKTGGTGGTLASPGVPKGGTKTIGFDDPYDPNPGNVSLAYTMRNAPEQERRAALINAWNKEHGRESVPYIPGTKIPAGSLNRSSSTYASPGISSGGTYATGEGIKDANGNILTNPGGNADYQYALRDPSYGIYVRDRLTDAQKNYLQAVSNNMGYNYNF